ncbi:hypothetical protein [Streptomyces huiliensis]|uniref:hypothetical protein n=1 Tax=Streptomyces huiliensis TaxID=2876027 RepID=UPI001CC1649B|nr:hypothetical protein [Streptomyces huiliensis]MBZ4321948.1 hypothetical protein [Streptomyces huiliensis]
MASTARTVLVPAAVAVALLAGLTACGSDSGSGKDDDPAKERTERSAHLAWPGAALPGLAAKPAWTVPAAPGGTAVFAVGDAFAVVTAPGAEKTANDKGTALRQGAKTVEFRDARDGAVRRTLRLGDARVMADTWHGAPALRVQVTTKTASDGMTSDKDTTVDEVYDGHGKKLGSAPLADGATFSDGWVAKGGSATRADGGSAIKLDTAGDPRAVQGPAHSQDQHRYAPERRTFAGDHAFSYEQVAHGPFDGMKRLVVTDLATGKKAWTTAEAGRPDKAIPEDKSHDINVVPVTVVGDRVVLAWQTDGDKHASAEPWILSVNDVRTGRLLATGPVVRADAPGSMTDFGDPVSNPTFLTTYDASTGTVVTAGQPDMGKPWLATAWDLKSGKRLWAQGPDEKDFALLNAGDGVVYGYTNPGTQGYWDPIAVDVKTKKVLAKKLDNDRIPVFSSDGHGAVSVDQGVFVFPAA